MSSHSVTVLVESILSLLATGSRRMSRTEYIATLDELIDTLEAKKEAAQADLKREEKK